MEKQWREAVAQVNGNKLGNKIEQYQIQVTKLNDELIECKKENQLLKLQIHTMS